MMRLKILFLAALLLIPLSAAESFDEFAGTYNNSYDAGKISITSYKSMDCKSECEGVNITLNISVAEPGTYSISAALGGKASSLEKHFFEGIDEIELLVPSPFYSNTSDLWIKIYEGQTLIYQDRLSTVNLEKYGVIQQNSTGAEEIVFLDDAVIDYNLEVYFNSTANATLVFYLFDEFSGYITQASAFSSLGKAVFFGEEINSSGLNGPYVVKTSINGEVYSYETDYYDYGEFARPADNAEKTDDDTDSSGGGSGGGGLISKLTKEPIDFTISFFSDFPEKISVDSEQNLEVSGTKQSVNSAETASSNMITGNVLADTEQHIGKKYIFAGFLFFAAIAGLLFYFFRKK